MEIRWLSRSSPFAEELHLRPAPARNQTAQSPLSQTIRKLEKDLASKRIRTRRTGIAGRSRCGQVAGERAGSVRPDDEVAFQALLLPALGEARSRGDACS